MTLLRCRAPPASYGVTDPTYAATAIMSSRVSRDTTPCIGWLRGVARVPALNANSWRRRCDGGRPAIGGIVSTPRRSAPWQLTHGVDNVGVTVVASTRPRARLPAGTYVTYDTSGSWASCRSPS